MLLGQNNESEAILEIFFVAVVLAHSGGTQEVADEDLGAEGEVLAHQVLRPFLLQVLIKQNSDD